MADINYQTDQIFDEKSAQQKIADDEYYAAFQSLIERDPIAKEYFDPDDIVYPLGKKTTPDTLRATYSGTYVYPGSTYDEYSSYAKDRKFPLDSNTRTKEKLDKGEGATFIYQQPLSTSTQKAPVKYGVDAFTKMSVILHEARHKAFYLNEEYKNFIENNKLNEEVFNIFLDMEFFPEIKDYEIKNLNRTYQIGYKGLKDKYEKSTKEFLKRFKKKSSIKDQITNLFN